MVKMLSMGIWLFTAQNVFAASVSPCELKGSPPPSPRLQLESVAKGFTEPLGLFHAGDGSGRVFIVEQPGTIRVLKNGRLSEKPFMDIRDRVTSGGETGLLGIAFHPKFSENHRLFVNYTSSAGGLHTVISEFKAGDNPGDNPDKADPKSERVLLTIPQPYPNHKGGNIVFGPDGYLYIGMGDGGSGNDPHGNGQNLSTLLGKMLRIDVNKKEKEKAYNVPRDNPFIGKKNAAPEIWAYGLRNPWRYSFDPVTGLLYVGDVGQNAREEIDVIRRGKNYGWNIMEGTICTPGVNPNCNKNGLELPIYDYPRSEGIAVIGGYVYRGRSIPNLCGAYVYGDYGNGRIWALRYDEKFVTGHRLLLESHRSISSFGEDEQREIYVVDHGGEVLKIVPATLP
ncbi:MAG TPA: PQQ-dependent sugar dehydrogenase [Nitrospiria bacterium]|nr:PQQ-dependent sugar dehydrogenase [Nitrospiria bacterium]